MSGGIRTPGPLLRRQLLYPTELQTHILERVMGIEPTYPAWKAGVLPLNYTRILPDQAFLVVFQAYRSINDIYYTTTRAFCQALFYIFFI